MRTRLILTGLMLAVSVASLTGCVVYPAPVGVSVERPAPYYYGYGPRYHYGYYGHRDD